jgi:hypothetical protein
MQVEQNLKHVNCHNNRLMPHALCWGRSPWSAAAPRRTSGAEPHSKAPCGRSFHKYYAAFRQKPTLQQPPRAINFTVLFIGANFRKKQIFRYKRADLKVYNSRTLFSGRRNGSAKE